MLLKKSADEWIAEWTDIEADKPRYLATAFAMPVCSQLTETVDFSVFPLIIPVLGPWLGFRLKERGTKFRSGKPT